MSTPRRFSRCIGPRSRALATLLVLTALAWDSLGSVATGAEGSTTSARSTVHRPGLSTPVALVGSTRWVSVPVGTLWASSSGSRAVDRLAVSPPASIRAWVSTMTLSQKRWLVGKVETQALYATVVLVVARSGGWSRVVVPSQPTPRDPRGYPGWIPTWELTTRSPVSTTSLAVVTSATTWLRSAPDTGTLDRIMEISYDTRLPVLATTALAVEVSLLDGRHAFLRRADVALQAARAPSSATGARVVAEARKFLGLAYLWGGTSGFGYDCSGFVYSVFHRLGVTTPRDAAPQATRGVAVLRRDLRLGDLVFFRDGSGPIGHVAIFLGSVHGVASVIHAPNTGQSVTITPLSSWPNTAYAGARRYTR